MPLNNQEVIAVKSIETVVLNHQRQRLDLVQTLAEVFCAAGLDSESVRAIAEVMEVREVSRHMDVRAEPAHAAPARPVPEVNLNVFTMHALADLVRSELAKPEINLALAEHCGQRVGTVSKSVFIEKESQTYPPGDEGRQAAAGDYDLVARYAQRAPRSPGR